MAEKCEEEDDSANSWWGSWYDSAKKKIAETNEFIARDLKEFTQVVKDDTSKFVAQTAISMKDQLNIQANVGEASEATKIVANSIGGFLGNVVKHIAPLPPPSDENADATMYVGTPSGLKVISPAEARLFALQTNPGTYCNEPDCPLEFEAWMRSFDLSEKKEELSLLMLDYKEVRTLYTRLVPDAVSHTDFWQRYFYKKHGLEQAEQRRALLVERAAKKETELSSWDDEDEYDSADVITSSDDVITSKDDVITPPDDVITPSDNVITPSDDVIIPSGDVIIPSDDVITTKDDIIIPSDNVITTKDDVILPSDDVITTKDDVIATDDDVIISSNDITAPIDDVINPIDDTKVTSETKYSDVTNTSEKPDEQSTIDDVTNNVKTSDNGDVIKAANCDVQEETAKLDCDVIDIKPTELKESTSGESSEWEKEFDLGDNDDELLQDIADEDIEGWDEWE